MMVAITFVLRLFQDLPGAIRRLITWSWSPVLLFAFPLRRGSRHYWWARLQGYSTISRSVLVPRPRSPGLSLAYGLLGLAGFFRRSHISRFGRRGSWGAWFPILSDIFLYPVRREGNVYLYSLVYNTQYLVPELIISLHGPQVCPGASLEVRCKIRAERGRALDVNLSGSTRDCRQRRRFRPVLLPLERLP